MCPEADQLDEPKLTEWMEANVEGFSGPLTLSSKFKGGQSNPTYRIDASGQLLCPAPPALRQAASQRARRGPRIYGNGRSLPDRLSQFPNPMGYVKTRRCSARSSLLWAWPMGATLWNGALPGASDPAERRANIQCDDRYDGRLAHDLKSRTRSAMSDFGMPTDYCAHARSLAGRSNISSPKPSLCPEDGTD